MKRLCIALLIIFTSCKSENKPTLKDGNYKFELDLGNNNILPFTASYNKENGFVFKNDTENIVVDEVIIKGDSILIKPPYFEGVFKAKIIADNTIEGTFVKASLDRIVPFTAKATTENRFLTQNNAFSNITGNWETVFSPDSETDSYIAKGVFKQNGNIVTGTFETTTGDYRYLEGVLDGDQLKLSTFDGAHAFLFKGKVTATSINGTFYSGNHFQEPFVANLNNDYKLPDANLLTYLKEGTDRFDFSFPDASGKMVSLSDSNFKDKVVIVQLMGSWCPNCLDESKFFVDYIANKKPKNVEFLALNFEYAATPEKAYDSMKRVASKTGIQYPMLLAQYGSVDKKVAAQKLPQLNHVLSFPTTIYVDKKGIVRRIHTGFDGPATGKKHELFKEDFSSFVENLSSE